MLQVHLNASKYYKENLKTWGFGNYLRRFCFNGIPTVSGEKQLVCVCVLVQVCECKHAHVHMCPHSLSNSWRRNFSHYIQDTAVDASDK